ncbi:hypothetical protein HDU79_001353 [Rhizoclosmatium sp. JEL0117]|nr:hypothetical protein HDU79_001353 [Rhizoclosmatium sp. JEL0117]
MVHLSLPTDVDGWENTSVTIGIQIDDEVSTSPELPFPNGSTDKSYVISKLNKQYSIVFSVINPNKITDPKHQYPHGSIHPNVHITIDGNLVKACYLPQRGRFVVKGKLEGDGELRFKFQAPKLVMNGGIVKKDEVEQIGTIQIEIWLARMESQEAVRPPSPTRHEVVEINEKTKKGVFVSSATAFGRKEKVSLRHVTSTNLTEYPLVKHTYHYKTRDWLELEEILAEEEEVSKRNAAVSSSTHIKHTATNACNLKQEGVKSTQSNSSVAKLQTSNPQLTNRTDDDDDDQAVVFMGSHPVKKKVVELVDLTEEPIPLRHPQLPPPPKRIRKEQTVDLTK